eukprot:COSAG04_NODE_4396_length_2121_cov_1.260138_1_plen_120_part_00
MPRAKASRGAMMRNRAAAVGHGRHPSSPNTNITLEYKSGAELGERSYVSITGSQYPAGGMVVQNTSRLFKDYPSLKSRGCMRTCGSHMRTDVSELLDAGWLHPTSKIVILPRFACCPSR